MGWDNASNDLPPQKPRNFRDRYRSDLDDALGAAYAADKSDNDDPGNMDMGQHAAGMDFDTRYDQPPSSFPPPGQWQPTQGYPTQGTPPPAAPQQWQSVAGNYPQQPIQPDPYPSDPYHQQNYYPQQPADPYQQQQGYYPQQPIQPDPYQQQGYYPQHPAPYQQQPGYYPQQPIQPDPYQQLGLSPAQVPPLGQPSMPPPAPIPYQPPAQPLPPTAAPLVGQAGLMTQDLPSSALDFQSRLNSLGSLPSPYKEKEKNTEEKSGGIDGFFNTSLSGLPCLGNVGTALIVVGLAVLMVCLMAVLALGSIDRHLGLGIFYQ